MTKMLKIVEINQTIVPATDFDEFRPSNEFIATLVAEAEESGSATREDAEGCPVTATVWEE